MHSRLAQHFVIHARVEGDSRLVTFSNGVEVRERIVTIDNERRRMVYAVTGWQTTHHNALFRVFDKDEGLTRRRLRPDNLLLP